MATNTPYTPSRPRASTSAITAPQHLSPSTPTTNAHSIPLIKLRSSTPRYLLLPTSRTSLPSASISTPQRSPRGKPSATKLTRTSRSVGGGADTHAALYGTSAMAASLGIGLNISNSTNLLQPKWLQAHLPMFEVVDDEVEVAGFQLYAVDKW